MQQNLCVKENLSLSRILHYDMAPRLELTIVQIPDVREEVEEPDTVRVTITLDRRVYDWFRRSGRGYQKRMNRALLWYIEQLEQQEAACQKR